MKVRLVSITRSYVEEASLDPEELIVYVARVSNPSNQLNTGTAAGLLAYLIKHKHWSPFEMVDMTVEIVTSRGIAQQILRHRSFSFQEFSQRYAEVTDFEPIQLRLKADKNRQSSSEALENEVLQNAVDSFIKSSELVYKGLLEAGVAKECARFVLPITTQTKIYMKGNVRSWIHYLGERTKEHTQLEHRQIAEEIRALFEGHFPNVAKALQDAR